MKPSEIAIIALILVQACVEALGRAASKLIEKWKNLK